VEGTADNKLRETWDRLIVLLIARPGEGWESGYEEIARRKIERLALPTEVQGAMSSARILSRSPSETSAEQEARARAWPFAFDCYCKKVATRRGGRDAAKEIKSDSRHSHRST
jgi:hypothetical protein